MLIRSRVVHLLVLLAVSDPLRANKLELLRRVFNVKHLMQWWPGFEHNAASRVHCITLVPLFGQLTPICAT